MAYIETTNAAQVLGHELTSTRNAITKLGAFFAGLFRFPTTNSGAEARFAEVQRLHQLSDAELAKMNLRRDEIVNRVFQDLYYC